MIRNIVRGLTVALLALGPTMAVAQPPALSQMNTPNVQFGIFSLRPDGSAGSFAGPSIEPDDSIERSSLYVSYCGVGATSKEAPTLASDVWKVSGRVLSRTSENAVVQVEWQRTRAGGQTMTQTSNSKVVTVGLTDRIPLDEAKTASAGDCPARRIVLEVRFTNFMGLMTSAAGGVARVGGGGGRVATGPASGGVTSLALRGGGAGGSGRIFSTGAPDVFVAELWLVHSAPNRPDEVTQTTTTASVLGGDFAFAPAQISTPAGSVSVRIAGTTEIGRDASGQLRFVFGATRKVTYTPTSRPPRDTNAPVDSGGVAKTVGPVPGPDEVLSYVMPPLAVPGGPTVPDGFSIRVRLTPR